ncbi:MAG: hypothetical protein PHD88_02660 [Firmicutes bacterium]|nr:hypothetical protein [Bacillota bacterium]
MTNRLCVLLGLCILSVVFVGCTNTPENTINSFVKALRKVDFEEAASYVDGKIIFEPIDKDQKDVYRWLFNKFTYTIKDIQVDGDVASATVDIANLDFVVIGGKLLGEVTSLKLATLFNDEELTDLDINELIIKRFRDSNAPKKTDTLTLELRKIDGDWKIASTKELERGILVEIKLLADLYEELKQ